MATLHSPIFVFHKSRVHILQPVTYTWCVENHQRLGHNLNPTKYRDSHSVNISFAYTITFYHLSLMITYPLLHGKFWHLLAMQYLPESCILFSFGPLLQWVEAVIIPSKELLWPGQETPLLHSAASWPGPIKYKFHTVTPPLPLGDFQGVHANILYKYVNMWEITRFVSKMLFLSFHFYWKANEWYVTVCNFGFLRT